MASFRHPSLVRESPLAGDQAFPKVIDTRIGKNRIFLAQEGRGFWQNPIFAGIEAS